LKDFDFSKSMKVIQEGSAVTCMPIATRHDGIRLHTANSIEYSEEQLLKIIKEQTIFFTTAMLENQRNIKKLCEMLDRGDSRLGGILDSRPIIKTIVEHARNEYLTDILTREIKDEN